MDKRNHIDHQDDDDDDQDYSQDNDPDRGFISKNLEAERKRRKKLNDRQLQLRSLVPNITNARTQTISPFYFFFIIFYNNDYFKFMSVLLMQMNKATIITDAITYIEELRKSVEELTNQILQMEATDEEKKAKCQEMDAEQETNNKCGIPV